MTPTRRRTWRRLLIPFLALSLVAAACGGDDDDDDDDGATTETTAAELTTTTVAEVSGEPVVVWLINNTEGGPASFPDRIGAIQAAAEAVNTRGGIQGRPLEVELCDHKFDPNEMTRCARDGIASDAVAAVGTFCILGDSIAAILDEGNLPEFGQHTCLYSTFRPLNFAHAAGVSPYADAQFRKELGATEFTYLRAQLQEPLTEEQIASIEESGLTYAGEVVFDPGAADWAPVAQQLKDSGAQVLGVASLSADIAVPMIQAMDAIDFKPNLIGAPGNFTQAVYDTIGESLSGRYYQLVGSLTPDADHPEIERFNAEMDEGQRAGIAAIEAPRTAAHVQGWLAIQMFEQIANSVEGEITRDSIIAAAQAAEDVDMGGVTQPWSPTGDDDPDTDGYQQYNDFYVVVFQDGAEVLLDDEPRCGRPDC